MKKPFMLLLVLLFVVGLLLTPLISSAVPGNGNGNSNAGGNGNHYGWGNGSGSGTGTITGTGSPVSVPEPGILFLLVSGFVGLAGWVAIRKRMI
jgi:hypothetical protein